MICMLSATDGVLDRADKHASRAVARRSTVEVGSHWGGGTTGFLDIDGRGQNPKEKPVVMKKFDRVAGPANSVPSPASQTIRGVSWYLSPISVPTIVDSCRPTGCSAKRSR